MKDERVVEYLLPKRIIKQEKVTNADILLTDSKRFQIFPNEKQVCKISAGGYIILDFGKEMCGGARILVHYIEGDATPLFARLRFGESVTETCTELNEKYACNDHSPRDFVVPISMLSDVCFGETGFRFLRIDMLTENKDLILKNVYAKSMFRDIQYIGDFKCNDELVNKIYDTARYTVHLNMQTNLWDGIKRDRLVWVGDMQPEVLAITDIFGESSCVEETLIRVVEQYPLPCWINDIAAYSMWLLQILYDYYLKTGKREFVKQFLPYAFGVINQLDKAVTIDGDIKYEKSGIISSHGYFLDWPTRDSIESKDGSRFLYVYILNNFSKLLTEFNEDNTKCVSIINRLKKAQGEVSKKQIVAFGVMSNLLSKEQASQKLLRNGAEGLSTFMSYFILRALFECGNTIESLNIMKEYYGGMLSRGATTFWEDFDINWLKNSGRIDEFPKKEEKDIHGDFGAYCYQGFRHSLCHGWSCGPVQFLTEKVLGVTVLESGCKKLLIKPNLCGLEWCRGVFPTPYGKVDIIHETINGKVVSRINAPKEIEIITD